MNADIGDEVQGAPPGLKRYRDDCDGEGDVDVGDPMLSIRIMAIMMVALFFCCCLVSGDECAY